MNNIKNIIIVEDEALVALSIKNLLKHNGYNVMRTFSNGLNLLGYLRTNDSKPDLITMDIYLSGEMKGHDIVDVINDEFPLIKIIYISAYSDNETMSKVAKTTYSAFQVKPFTEDQLLKSIKGIADKIFS